MSLGRRLKGAAKGVHKVIQSCRTGPGAPGASPGRPGAAPGQLLREFYWDSVRFKWVMRMLLYKGSSFINGPLKAFNLQVDKMASK